MDQRSGFLYRLGKLIDMPMRERYITMLVLAKRQAGAVSRAECPPLAHCRRHLSEENNIHFENRAQDSIGL